MPDLLIRPATLADIPAITAIYRPAVVDGTASFELDPPDEAEMARRYQGIIDAGFPYLVVEGEASPQAPCNERSAEVLGYAYFSHYRTRPAYRFSVENSIYVAPAAHRRGVGRLLLERLITVATERGFRQMIAVIGDGRQQVASIGLHEAAGFTHCGSIQSIGWKHGRWLDSVLMQRPVGAGDTSPPA